MLKRITLILFALFAVQRLAAAQTEQQGSRLRLIFFYSLSCHECMKVKEEVLPRIKEKFAQKIEIDYRDIGRIEDYRFFLSLKERFGSGMELKVPVVWTGKKFLSGAGNIAQGLEPALEEAGAFYASEERESRLAAVDLARYFLSFTPLAVAVSALIDGINPCAFTVIVFFISFLSLQGYRRRQMLLIGALFISAVFLTYLLLGLGLLGFFYQLKAFWSLRRLVNSAIGIFSLALGSLAVYDLLKYKKSGKAEETVLQLPQALKIKIQALIGAGYRRSAGKDPHPARSSMFKLGLTAFATGFLVSLLEAVCTGQTYLPTIAFILKTAPVKLRALGFLILYNLIFVLPLFLILALALLGVSSGQFSRWLKKHFLTLKALMASLFFGLGMFLIWKG